MDPNAPGARPALEDLRAAAARVQTLEERIERLQHEHDRVLGSNRELSYDLAELRGAMGEWEWFFEHSLEMMCIGGMDGRFKRVNPAFCAALGFSAEELITRPFFDFIHPEDQERTMEVLQGLGNATDCINFENRYRDREGEWHWITWRCPALEPGSRNIYAIARDITHQKRTEAELLHRAQHDSLTGLLNRAAFEDGLYDAVLRAGRSSRHELALFLVDLDGFKQVNDSRGHQAGDRLLRKVSARLRRIAREGEMVSRIGGDEFALLIEGESGLRVDPLAQRIDEAMRLPDDPEDADTAIGCCIGISILPRCAPDVGALFEQADQALYRVKRAGKGGYSIYSPGTEDTAEAGV